MTKEVETFYWITECESTFNILKENMVSAPIIMSPNSNVEFQVHVDAFNIALGVILE